MRSKPVFWMGSTREDLRALAEQVRRDIGQALYATQQGGTDPVAKPLRGFGSASVMEIVDRYDTDTYRAVYTTRFCGHALRPPCLPEAIDEGHRDATERHRVDQTALGGRKEAFRGRAGAMKRRDQITIQKGSGNVFADLGLPSPEQEQVKADLTLQICRIIKERNLTQTKPGRSSESSSPTFLP